MGLHRVKEGGVHKRVFMMLLEKSSIIMHYSMHSTSYYA